MDAQVPFFLSRSLSLSLSLHLFLRLLNYPYDFFAHFHSHFPRHSISIRGAFIHILIVIGKNIRIRSRAVTPNLIMHTVSFSPISPLNHIHWSRKRYRKEIDLENERNCSTNQSHDLDCQVIFTMSTKESYLRKDIAVEWANLICKLIAANVSVSMNSMNNADCRTRQP